MATQIRIATDEDMATRQATVNLETRQPNPEGKKQEISAESSTPTLVATLPRIGITVRGKRVSFKPGNKVIESRKTQINRVKKKVATPASQLTLRNWLTTEK